MTKSIAIKNLRLDGDTQSRVDIEQWAVDEYTEVIKAGAKLPPIIVYYDGKDNWIVDGFQRWFATREAGLSTIRCDVRKGTLEEARWFSYSVNQTHGLRRSNADKAKAVEAALKHPKGAKMSNRQIAEHVGVAEGTVRNHREEIESTAQITQSSARTGADGRTIDTSNIGKQPDDDGEIVYVEEDAVAPEGYEYVDVKEKKEDQGYTGAWRWIEREAASLADDAGGKRVSKFLNTLAQEVQRDASVAFCRLENLAIKLM